ncbi:WGxxGxxG family protein [Scytonema sp. NUACC26]|uniref:WGxxGxxG family protein n=1 Tax=Scytonema sp. NUACC26 TaxID=3140176 RepID=UPI0034DC0196
MKNKLTTAIGAGVIGLSLAVMPLTLPASAQTNRTDTGTTTGNTTTDTTTYRGDNDFNWGWLGLLGLLGLGGLAGKRREEARYRDPNATVGSSTYRE